MDFLLGCRLRSCLLAPAAMLQRTTHAVNRINRAWFRDQIRIQAILQFRPGSRSDVLYLGIVASARATTKVDQVVLDVLIHKATTIRKSLGIAVPVPVNPEQVMETVVDRVLLTRVQREQQLALTSSK